VVGRVSQPDDAAVLAERFRAVVAASPVPLAGHGEARLTASLGFTHCPLPRRQPREGAAEAGGQTVDGVVALADRALYTAKRTGKNRSVALP
jgi:GGDEF domain-containing protein